MPRRGSSRPSMASVGPLLTTDFNVRSTPSRDIPDPGAAAELVSWCYIWAQPRHRQRRAVTGTEPRRLTAHRHLRQPSEHRVRATPGAPHHEHQQERPVTSSGLRTRQTSTLWSPATCWPVTIRPGRSSRKRVNTRAAEAGSCTSWHLMCGVGTSLLGKTSILAPTRLQLHPSCEGYINGRRRYRAHW